MKVFWNWKKVGMCWMIGALLIPNLIVALIVWGLGATAYIWAADD